MTSNKKDEGQEGMISRREEPRTLEDPESRRSSRRSDREGREEREEREKETKSGKMKSACGEFGGCGSKVDNGG